MCEVIEKDLYAVLGACPSDSAQQLKHKYQALALQYHPDRLRLKDSSVVDSALKKFLEIDAAWKILRDQDTRRQYDLGRRAQDLKQNWPVDSTVCLENMTWDPDMHMYTDRCRCGGAFCLTQEEVEEETQKMPNDDEEKEETTGVFVCCDTCSLSVYVTISLFNNTKCKSDKNS